MKYSFSKIVLKPAGARTRGVRTAAPSPAGPSARRLADSFGWSGERKNIGLASTNRSRLRRYGKEQAFLMALFKSPPPARNRKSKAAFNRRISAANLTCGFIACALPAKAGTPNSRARRLAVLSGKRLRIKIPILFKP